MIRDTKLFDPVLIGRKSASQGDSWVREWEGDPSFLSGRTHPMGIALDQRSLAWNFPNGNEDIIYFIFTFYNVTAKASSGKYNNPTIDPALQAEIGDHRGEVGADRGRVVIHRARGVHDDHHVVRIRARG